MQIITIDGEDYHADDDGVVLLSEYDNKPLSAYICICAAHNSYECCCGAWDRPLPGDE